MAMIDYGAIVFKNGKCITNNMFTPMKEAVGWEDTPDMKTTYGNEPLHLKNNYFAYVGDKEHTIAFYKCQLVDVYHSCDYIFKETEFFNYTNFKWYKWKKLIGDEWCVVKPRNGYYVCKWKYKGDKYKIYFGNGVDIDSYKRWHIVNYYRSIPYYWSNFKYWFKRHFLKKGW